MSFRSIELTRYMVEGEANWMGLDIRKEGNELIVDIIVKWKEGCIDIFDSLLTQCSLPIFVT